MSLKGNYQFTVMQEHFEFAQDRGLEWRNESYKTTDFVHEY